MQTISFTSQFNTLFLYNLSNKLCLISEYSPTHLLFSCVKGGKHANQTGVPKEGRVVFRCENENKVTVIQVLTHTHTHTHTHTRTRTHTHTHTHACMLTRVHVCTHMHACAHTCTHEHTHISIASTGVHCIVDVCPVSRTLCEQETL